jgi:hypothetical protein
MAGVRMIVEIWACDCGNYYGSSSIHGKDLTQEMNTKINTGEKTHSRAQCPNCKKDRVKYVADIGKVVSIA